MTESNIMRMARLAAERIAKLSPEKQEYLRRAVGQSPQGSKE